MDNQYVSETQLKSLLYKLKLPFSTQTEKAKVLRIIFWYFGFSFSDSFNLNAENFISNNGLNVLFDLFQHENLFEIRDSLLFDAFEVGSGEISCLGLLSIECLSEMFNYEVYRVWVLARSEFYLEKFYAVLKRNAKKLISLNSNGMLTDSNEAEITVLVKICDRVINALANLTLQFHSGSGKIKNASNGIIDNIIVSTIVPITQLIRAFVTSTNMSNFQLYLSISRFFANSLSLLSKNAALLVCKHEIRFHLEIILAWFKRFQPFDELSVVHGIRSVDIALFLCLNLKQKFSLKKLNMNLLKESIDGDEYVFEFVPVDEFHLFYN